MRVANAEMGRALRVISVERGLDPREFALVAFGGAGGLHACALAEELGIPAVLVPRAGGVLSALGLAMSDVRRDYVRPLLGGEDATEAFEAMEAQAGEDMDDPELRRRADLRYRGQSFELTVEADDLDAVAGALRRGARAPLRLPDGGRGRRARQRARSWRRWRSRSPSSPPRRPRATPRPASARRTSTATGARCRSTGAPAWARASRSKGPAIVEFAEATCVVRPGWAGAIDATGTLVLERSE